MKEVAEEGYSIRRMGEETFMNLFASIQLNMGL